MSATPPAAFERVITPRFHEVDRAGIAFFGRVFEYCHVVYEELWAALTEGKGLITAFDDLGFGTPVVHTSADYKKPMRMGQPLHIALTVSALTERTFTLDYDVRGPDGTPHATVKVVHVAIDMAAFKSRPLPEFLLDGFRRLGLIEGLQEPDDGGA
ncbi:MAG: acyl-CoA thioesterase [Bradymonadia bacterium]